MDTTNFFKPRPFPGQTQTAPALSQVPVERKPLPTFIRTKDTGDKVFIVVADKYHWIQNPEIYKAVGGDLGQEKMVERSDLAGYIQGEVVTLQNAEKYKIPDPKEMQKNPAMEQKEEIAPPVVAKSFPPETDQTCPAPSMDIVPGKTSIIIPAYFAAYHLFHYTGNCIGSIREHTDKLDTPYEIILVINGSKDSAIKFSNLEETLCDKVIVNEENMGYGYAMNQGIRASVGQYLCFMNNDVMVFEHWLEDMLEALRCLDLVMATPMYGKPFARAKEAEELRKKTERELPETGRPYSQSLAEDFLSDFRDFSCALTRRSLMEEVGLFNEKLFAYKEDIDLYNRLDAAGKKYASTKRVNTFHVIGSTSVGMNDAQLHKKEGEEEFNKLWRKS